MIMSPQEMREAIIKEKRLHVEQSIISMVNQMMTGLKFYGQTIIRCANDLDVQSAKDQANELLKEVVKAGWFVHMQVEHEYHKGHVTQRYLIVNVKEREQNGNS